jgi:hypothetical protein
LYKAVGGGWVDMPIEQMLPETVREEMETRTNWGDLLKEPLPASADGQDSQPGESK